MEWDFLSGFASNQLFYRYAFCIDVKDKVLAIERIFRGRLRSKSNEFLDYLF